MRARRAGTRARRGFGATVARRRWARPYRALRRAQPGPRHGGHAQIRSCRSQLQFTRFAAHRERGGRVGGLIDSLLEWMQGLPPALVYLVIGAFAALENIFPPVPADVIALFGGFLTGQGIGDPLFAFLVV